jgi:uncharacterized membrane protein YbhN (UPF0104 family)
MIPVTIGGLGLRENLFVTLFSQHGMHSSQAGAISLLYLIVNLIFALIGGIMFLFIKKEAKEIIKGGA